MYFLLGTLSKWRCAKRAGLNPGKRKYRLLKACCLPAEMNFSSCSLLSLLCMFYTAVVIVPPPKTYNIIYNSSFLQAHVPLGIVKTTKRGFGYSTFDSSPHLFHISPMQVTITKVRPIHTRYWPSHFRKSNNISHLGYRLISNLNTAVVTSTR